MAIPHRQDRTLRRASRLSRWELLLLYFLLGLFAVVAQSILVREFLIISFGSELSFGLTFFGWLAGVATGAAAGGLVGGGERLRRWLFLGTLVMLAYLLPVQIVLVRMSRLFLDVKLGEFLPLWTMLWLNPLLTVPVSFLIGFAFPLAAGLMARDDRAADPIARVYAVEAAGSLMGGALFSFVLIERFPALTVAFLVGGLLLLALVVLTIARARWWIVVGPAVGVFIVLNLLGLDPHTLREWSLRKRWESFRTGTEPVAPGPVDSRYQNITLAGRLDEFTVFLDGLAAMSFPAPTEHAVAAHFVMCEAKDVRCVLLIGGGIEGVLSEMLKHPVERLDYVSLDPKLVELIRPHLLDADREALSDPRVNIHYDDGRHFLAQRSRDEAAWDLVFLDMPEPTSVLLNRFYTVSFFRIIREHLDGDGLLVFRLTGTPGYFTPERRRYLASIWNALGEAFPHRMATWGEETFFLASPTPHVFTADGAELARRYASRGVRSGNFHPAWFEGGSDMLEADKLRRMREELAQASSVEANTDEHPRACLHNLILADLRISADLRPEERRTPALAHLNAMNLNHALLAAVVVFATWALIAWWPMRRPAAESATLFSVATTGFSAMAMELVLLTVFQYLYGYVYVRVGIIIGTFMLGLVGGSLLMNRLLRRRPHWGVRALRHLDEALVLLFILTPFVIALLKPSAGAPQTAWMAEWGIMTLVLLSGLLGGVVFPLSAQIILRTKRRTGRAAGAVDAADHVGACIGALIAGVVLIPALGIIETCVFLAVLKVLSALFLLFARH